MHPPVGDPITQGRLNIVISGRLEGDLGELKVANSTTGAWGTALSETTDDSISIRGYDLAELVGAVPFPASSTSSTPASCPILPRPA